MTNTADYYEPTSSANRTSVTNEQFFTESARHQLKEVYGKPEDSDGNSVHGSSAAESYTYGNEDQYFMGNEYAKRAAPKSQLILIQRFKKELEGRGGRGLIGLRKQFKLFDANGNGTLEMAEFTKAVLDFEVDLHPKDIDNLFKTFDRNGDGHISYEELLISLVGQMSKNRYELIEKAFSKVAGPDGCCSVAELTACFDGARHPDVARGKMDAATAAADFREAFEMHHNTTHDYDAAAPVSLGEFIEFYACSAAMTESEHEFDQLVSGPWNTDRNSYASMPYAGTAQSVTEVDAHEKWKLDHHRKMFSGNDVDILVPNSHYKGASAEWTTTSGGNFAHA